MSIQMKRAVQEFYARAWNAGDLSVIDELFASDYRDHDAAAQTGEPGLEGAREFIRTFRRAIPDLRCEIEDQIAEEHKVVTRWVATGTHRDTLLGVPPSRRPICVSGISIDRFDEDGRFLEGWGNWDGIALLQQIGGLG